MVAGKDEAAATHSWDLSGRRVLVIDDEREILDAMQTLLSKWGCEVVVAVSLDNAVSELSEKKIAPDLILSDLRLSDTDTGIDVLDSLRRQFGESIPGILITGETAPEQIEAARNSGYILLQKPVQPARLRTVIQHHLSTTL